MVKWAAVPVETKRHRGRSSLKDEKDSELLTQLVVLFVHVVVSLKREKRNLEKTFGKNRCARVTKAT